MCRQQQKPDSNFDMTEILKSKSPSPPFPSHARAAFDRRKTSHPRTSQAERKAGGADRAGHRKLSKRELADIAVTYAALLDIEIRKFDPREFGFRVGPGRGRPSWIALGKAEPGELTFIPGYWHAGPGSRYAAASEALAAMGYRISPNGGLDEF
jgi:hypothetical protein